MIYPGLLLQERYLVVKRLGKGGFCETWKVDDRGTPKVLKVLLDDYPKLIELFQREVEVLQQFNHPGIPKVQSDGCYFTFQPEGARVANSSQISVGAATQTTVPDAITQTIGIGHSPSNISSHNQNELRHCLVMEFIEGQDLKKWLAQRNNQPISQEQAIAWLKQLVEILAQIHARKYFHRDIKPSNIMCRPNGKLVLIDFGAVREITATFIEKCENQRVTRLYSAGYTAPEQFRGQAVPESDFFALGRTFVFLLTGKVPTDFQEDSQTFQLQQNWRDSAPHVSTPLADFIDKLMASVTDNRIANIEVILRELDTLEQTIAPRPAPTTPTGKVSKRIVGLGLVGALGLAAVVSDQLNQQNLFSKSNKIKVTPVPPNVSDSVDSQESCHLYMGDYLSCGENSLLSGGIIPEKKQGIAEFAYGNYKQAIKSLESARKKTPRDPEILIYLNNARIAAQKADHYTIAVAVTLNSDDKSVNDSGAEFLRGVAQAQQQVNQGQKINGKMLRVAIADDGGEVDQSKEIAKALGAQDDILAVVGHHSSELTEGAVQVYKQNKLVLISPSSASTKILATGNFFFRTISNNRVLALVLAQNMVNTFKQKKAAVFYNRDSLYSGDIKEKFNGTGVNVVKDFDMSDRNFDAESAIAEAEELGAEMLVLFPAVKKRRNAREVIKANQGRYCIMEPSGLYESETLNEVGKEAKNRLIMSNPWQREDNPEFTKQASDLWQGHVNWRTALAYDATRALIAALANKSQANRSSVQQALADPNFKTSGATGTISFEPNGDRKEQIQTLSIVVASEGGYKFVPINQASSIDCDLP